MSTECRLLPLSSTRTEQAGLRDSSSELTTPFCIYVLLLRVVVVLGVLGVVAALSRYKSKNMFKSPRVLIRGRRTRWLAGLRPSTSFCSLGCTTDRPNDTRPATDRRRPTALPPPLTPPIQHPSSGAPSFCTAWDLFVPPAGSGTAERGKCP